MKNKVTMTKKTYKPTTKAREREKRSYSTNERERERPSI